MTSKSGKSLSGILHKTHGIVLRTVKYGETSLVVTVFTEKFGVQTYMLNGVRTASKKGSARAGLLQPAALLEMEVYYNEFRHMNRIREFQWARQWQYLFTDIFKNGVALYMIELLTRCLKQPDTNEPLFAFTEDCLLHLDICTDAEMANFPLFYAIHVAQILGFAPQLSHGEVLESEALVFDMQEGVFTTVIPVHLQYMPHREALSLALLLQVRHPSELTTVKMNVQTRRAIMDAIEVFYSLHVQDFGRMKTAVVLREILN